MYKDRKFLLTISAPKHLSREFLGDAIVEAVRLFPQLKHCEVDVSRPKKCKPLPPTPSDANAEQWPSTEVERMAWALWCETQMRPLRSDLERLKKASQRVLTQAKHSIEAAHTPLVDGFNNALAEDLRVLSKLLDDLKET